MQLSPPVKTVLVLVLVVAAAAYLVLVDLAVNAGRIHRGVAVEDLDVGGLSRTEAEEVLTARGEEMKTAPMIFTAEGFDCRFTPEDVGWGPQPSDTVTAALGVGRDATLWEDLGDRFTAWTDGVRIDWAGSPNPDKVDEELDRCEELAAAMGVTIDRGRLRYKIRRAIVTWPRRPFRIPLEE
ncbi:MAG: hypothetical protein M3N53_01380 [Actinomycetota bacterium]|nr:hypothetical protein [Actinomycetota bacterium]